jgi:hypothetical protein
MGSREIILMFFKTIFDVESDSGTKPLLPIDFFFSER